MRPFARFLFPVLIAASLGWCQLSTPAAWRFAPAAPSFLLGVDWRQASQSAIAPLAGAAVSEAAGLGFVEELNSLLVTAEPKAGKGRFLAIATGRFDLAAMRRMAAAEKAVLTRTRGVEIFTAQDMAAAILEGRICLVGDKASVTAAIFRGAGLNPRDGDLWRRAIEYSTHYPLWIASDASADLRSAGSNGASPFAGVRTIDGGIALQRGLEAVFDLGLASAEEAAALAASLQAAANPAFGRIGVQAQGTKVRVEAVVEMAQLETSLKTMLAAGASRKGGLSDWLITGTSAAPPATPTLTAAVTPPTPPAPPRRRTIRIVGLEEGTREIPYPSPDR